MKKTMQKRFYLWLCIVLGMMLLCAACIGLYQCNKKEKDLKSFDRYVVFTDTVTGVEYRIDASHDSLDISIPYDGLVHEFDYEVYNIKTDKPYGQSGRFRFDCAEDIAQEPGAYGYELETYQRGYMKVFNFSVTIVAPPKLQPEMKFNPNGAIEYEDGVRYVYKYTGKKCYPIAYGEYDGKRLDGNVAPEYLIEGCHNVEVPNIGIPGPKEIGVYVVRFCIAHYKEDLNLETYYSIRQEVIVEIVE